MLLDTVFVAGFVVATVLVHADAALSLSPSVELPVEGHGAIRTELSFNGKVKFRCIPSKFSPFAAIHHE